MDVDIPAFGFIYSILMIVVGQFFLLNFFLAVIVCSFVKAQQADVREEIEVLQNENEEIKRFVSMR